MKKLLSYLLVIFVVQKSLSAQTRVHCPTAGYLATVFDSLHIKADTLSNLVLTGNLDARDFETLKANYYSTLKVLDISEVNIKGFTGKLNENSEIESFPPNEVPGIHNFDLTTVILPTSATSIREFAFSSMPNLTTIIFPPNIKRIGNCAFYKSPNLHSSILLPSTFEYIGSGAFNYCNKIGEIQFEQPNNHFIFESNEVVYSANKDTLLYMPPYFKGKYRIRPETKVIRPLTLSGIEGLTSLTLSDSLTNIGNRAFADCTNLSWLNIKKCNLRNGINAFDRCTKIDTIYAGYSKQYIVGLHTGLISVKKASCKVFVPTDSIQAFRQHEEWGRYTHLYEVETMPEHQDDLTITAFKIKSSIPMKEDTTLYAVTLEFHGNHAANYTLSKQCNQQTDYSSTAPSDTSLLTISNVNRRFDNIFSIYASSHSGANSETKQITLKADLLNSIAENLSDKISIYLTNKNTLNIKNDSREEFNATIYNSSGAELQKIIVHPGINCYQLNSTSTTIITKITQENKTIKVAKLVIR
ncbi:MAG: hypothetical protein RIS29_239 [Bacteroidota bacterium]|jgi:hypothetical protein